MRIKFIFLTILIIVATAVNTVVAINRKARACLQPAQSGRCFGYVPSYAYDPIKRKCEEFIYGGCGGNENRFESKAECELSCREI